ncbi:MAG: cobalt chelatase [Pseudomonadota bacterium]
MNEQVLRRRIERHCAASIRALSARPEAEFRAQRLLLNERTFNLRTPHLSVDVINHPLVRARGVADAMALRLVHSDAAMHRAMSPNGTIARIVFDVLEQVRVECLAPADLPGMRRNLQQGFDLWCLEARGTGLTENEVGLMVFSVTHIVRSRLRNEMLDEDVDQLVESTRYRLAPIVGVELSKLRAARFDQREYAPLALKIAQTAGEFCDRDEDGDDAGDAAVVSRYRMLLPPTDEDITDGALHASGILGVSASGEVENTSDYHVFTREFDQETNGEVLFRQSQREAMREQLDQMIAAQAISVPRLALRLQRLFSIPRADSWNFGQEEGYLDGRRLTQLAANSAYRQVFKQVRETPHTNLVVSFLIDNSGSMKRQRFEAVAVLVDIFARALELAGAKTEILGFTTRAWSGGQAFKAWRAHGEPAQPGRTNERLHIVYKDSDTSWRRSRHSIASLMNPQHFREGLDGEALEWAAQRLRQTDADRRALVMISDGAPMDSTTLNVNDKGFLDRHLYHVAQSIERRGDIELRAIGIGLDMGEFFRRSIALDLTGTLGNRAFSALEQLYSPTPPKDLI